MQGSILCTNSTNANNSLGWGEKKMQHRLQLEQNPSAFSTGCLSLSGPKQKAVRWKVNKLVLQKPSLHWSFFSPFLFFAQISFLLSYLLHFYSRRANFMYKYVMQKATVCTTSFYVFFFFKEVFFLGFSFRHPRSLAWGPWFSRPILKSNPETSTSYLYVNFITYGSIF